MTVGSWYALDFKKEIKKAKKKWKNTRTLI
jgi:hypothetical protein